MKSQRQEMISTMIIPMNEDHVACDIAIQELLSEGWKFTGIDNNDNGYSISLRREWEFIPAQGEYAAEPVSKPIPERKTLAEKLQYLPVDCDKFARFCIEDRLERFNLEEKEILKEYSIAREIELIQEISTRYRQAISAYVSL